MSDLVWTVERRKLSTLKKWADNPRKLTEKDYEKLKSRIKARGFHDILKIDIDGTIVSGNQRKEALKELGFDEVDVKVPNRPLTEKERQDVALESNLHDGSWDWDELANGFDEKDLLDIGFEDKDLGKFRVEGEEDDFDADKALEEVGEPKTKLGDLYQLGSHRLMCGDSTKKEDVESLMDGKKADMVFTDPPYGVSYADKNKFLNSISPGNRIQTEIINDHKSVEDLQENVIYPAFCNIREALSKEGTYYITAPQGGDLLMMMMMMQKADIPLRHMLIWVKNNHVLGRTDYNYKHEPILFGWIDKHHFYGNGSFTKSVWEVDKPHESKLHPTMKPIALIENAIKNSSKDKDSVLDLFGGSGSTLIACEQTGRECRMMELDPKYCDVIVKRWEQFTNKKAVKI